MVDVVKGVAERLGNTPAVCRSSYIDPRVFDAWRAGRLHRAVPPVAVRATRRFETIALGLLRREAPLSKRRGR
jgi:DNA topoisomerase IB